MEKIERKESEDVYAERVNGENGKIGRKGKGEIQAGPFIQMGAFSVPDRRPCATTEGVCVTNESFTY